MILVVLRGVFFAFGSFTLQGSLLKFKSQAMYTIDKWKWKFVQTHSSDKSQSKAGLISSSEGWQSINWEAKIIPNKHNNKNPY